MTTRIMVLPLIVIMICSSFSFFSVHSVDGSPVDVVADTEPPVLSNVSLSGSPTTGDPVTISVDVSDNMNVNSVWLVHNWSSLQPAEVRNVSFMRAGDMFSITIMNPINTTSSFWYMVKANDTSDNWNTTSWYSVNISDNDPPIFLFDGSTEFAYTGEAFGFVTNMDDNIGVFRASINFTIDGGTNYNFSMCGAGNSRQTLIVIPLEAQGSMEYFFWFSDGAGNEGTSPVFNRTIYDITPPFVIEDLTMGPVNSSDILKIHLRVIDNWGIVEGWMNYEMEGWYQDPAKVPFQIPGDGNFTILFAIPGNFTGNFTYNTTFVDSSLNQITTENRTIVVNDRTRPKLVDDLTNRITTTGEEMIFGFKVDDNIAVSEVAVTYKFPGEDWYTSFTSYQEQWDSWLYDLDVPTSREGEGQYYVKITDTSGNFYLGDVRTFYIFDNDDPEILFEDNDMEAVTGESFTFRLAASDNVWVSSVSVDYTFGDVVHRIDLERGEPVGSGYLYLGTITIPDDAMDIMTYVFTVHDQRGNVFEMDGNIEIIDVILPRIVDVRFYDVLTDVDVSYLTTGDTFEIEVDVIDNVDPKEVRFLWILPGSVQEISVNMTRGLKFNGTRTFNTTISTPSDLTGPISYRIIAKDVGGIENISSQERIFLLDNDAPGILNITHPEENGLDTLLNITIEAVDNIKVVSATIIFHTYGITLSILREKIEMVTEDGRAFSISTSVEGLGIGPVGVEIEVSDGKNNHSQTIQINVIDDVAPNAFIIAPGSGAYPDNDMRNFVIGVYDDSEWEVISIAMVQGDIGVEIIDHTIVDRGREDDFIDLIEFQFTPSWPGSWEIQLHLKDENDAHSFSTFQFTVFDATPPYFKLEIPKEIEEGKVVNLEATDLEDSSQIVKLQWIVTGPDGEKLMFTNNSIEFEPWGVGIFNITLSVTDEFGNNMEKTKWLTVEPKSEEDNTYLPLIILIVLTAIIGGLVLWVSVKEKLPIWMRNWKDR